MLASTNEQFLLKLISFYRPCDMTNKNVVYQNRKLIQIAHVDGIPLLWGIQCRCSVNFIKNKLFVTKLVDLPNSPMIMRIFP